VYLQRTDRQTAKRFICEQILCLAQYICTCVTWLMSQLLIKLVERLAFMKTKQIDRNGGTNCYNNNLKPLTNRKGQYLYSCVFCRERRNSFSL